MLESLLELLGLAWGASFVDHCKLCVILGQYCSGLVIGFVSDVGLSFHDCQHRFCRLLEFALV